MSPVNPQHHEIRNYFLKPFHLLGGDRKLKHQLSIKSLQTIKKKKKPKESKGFEIEHGSLIKEGSVSNLMTPQDIQNGHLKKKICPTNISGNVEKEAVIVGRGASTIVTLTMGFWRLE